MKGQLCERQERIRYSYRAAEKYIIAVILCQARLKNGAPQPNRAGMEAAAYMPAGADSDVFAKQKRKAQKWQG
jgi:hypothetical protein